MKLKFITFIFTLILIIIFNVMLSAQPGSLDLTFDADGIVTTSVSNTDDFGRAVALQQDGKIRQ